MTAKQRERKQGAIVESLRLGVSIVAACVATGIGRATFYRWLSDEDFEEAVCMARMAVVQEAMAELWKQAQGYYVDEERVVETASGPKKVTRMRRVSGKVSAVNAILRMMEKDGKELAKFLGTTEETEGTEGERREDYEYDYEYEHAEGGDLEPGMDRNEREWEGGDVSRFEADSEKAGIAVRDDCGHHGGQKGGIAVRDDCGHHGGQKAGIAVRDDCGHHLTRRERRALEREAYRAAKKAAKAAKREG